MTRKILYRVPKKRISAVPYGARDKASVSNLARNKLA